MPAGGEIFQYTFIQQLPLTIMETVIHFRARTLAAITLAQHTAVADNWLSSMARCQSNRVLYTQVRVKQLTPIGFDQIPLVPTYAAGQVNEDPANNQLAIVVTKRTGVAGIRHRGRLYIGGFPISGGIQGLLGGSLVAASNAMVAEFLTKFGEDGTDPTMCAGVYSKAIGGSLPFTLAGWQPITRWEPQLLFGVQRKRKPGVGI